MRLPRDVQRRKTPTGTSAWAIPRRSGRLQHGALPLRYIRYATSLFRNDLLHENLSCPSFGPTASSASSAWDVRRPRIAPTASPAVPHRWSHKPSGIAPEHPPAAARDGQRLHCRSVDGSAIRARGRALAGAGTAPSVHDRASIVFPAFGFRPGRLAHPHPAARLSSWSRMHVSCSRVSCSTSTSWSTAIRSSRRPRPRSRRAVEAAPARMPPRPRRRPAADPC